MSPNFGDAAMINLWVGPLSTDYNNYANAVMMAGSVDLLLL